MIRLVPRGALAALILAVAAALAGPALAQDEAAQSKPQPGDIFDAGETEAIRAMIREYIMEHPEVIIEAVERMRQREQEAADARRQEALKAHQEALKDPGPLPVLGNPDGDVTVVEFFDYRCPYCRSVAPDLMEVVRDDGNVRLVLKEFPILGQASLFAARAAIAAARQDAYPEFHKKLMTEVQEVNQASVLKLAERMGLDTAQLQQDMQSAEVDQELQRTYRLAEALQIGGTPAFVVGDEMAPGAVGPDKLKEMIAKARQQEG